MDHPGGMLPYLGPTVKYPVFRLVYKLSTSRSNPVPMIALTEDWKETWKKWGRTGSNNNGLCVQTTTGPSENSVRKSSTASIPVLKHTSFKPQTPKQIGLCILTGQKCVSYKNAGQVNIQKA